MKKTSSGLNVGLWVAGGLVGVYLFGFVILLIDPITVTLPDPVADAISFLYGPLFRIIGV